ncbi:hypothetical protein BO78DRAFT_427965 [Aspergillus sclerotiicarbonarius CBS 121057]|uniref:Uncharacterized protein n=1 Tax=Aspergillus sclerotiicarbonarius (strain CBS 121057 / IBT 28362) TaxID=1448318 RepID=A0A319EVW6_ASPSB|nr:hypothetical protein BO78DRAFT_427965 [Aspergillus sclerotiicarbonarius CBS 121057]
MAPAYSRQGQKQTSVAHTTLTSRLLPITRCPLYPTRSLYLQVASTEESRDLQDVWKGQRSPTKCGVRDQQPHLDTPSPTTIHLGKAENLQVHRSLLNIGSPASFLTGSSPLISEAAGGQVIVTDMGADGLSPSSRPWDRHAWDIIGLVVRLAYHGNSPT